MMFLVGKHRSDYWLWRLFAESARNDDGGPARKTRLYNVLRGPGRFFKVLLCATNFKKMLEDDTVVSYSNKLLQSSVKVLQKSTRYVACPGPDQGREGSKRYWIRWWQILSDLRHFLKKRKIHPYQPRESFCDNFGTNWRQLGGNLEITLGPHDDYFMTIGGASLCPLGSIQPRLHVCI